MLWPKRMRTLYIKGSLLFAISAFLLIITSSQCKPAADRHSINDSAQIASLIKLDCGVIPVENFFKNPEKTAFCISPDGEFISYLGPVESRLNIFVQKADGKSPAVQVT